MNCTLSVNTGACLSRRRVSTGVFTNQTCAVNRKRSKVFITGADPGGAAEDAVGLFYSDSRHKKVVLSPKQNKRDSQRTTASFGEGILLLMGCSQNYIMYWGVTSIIIYKCF